MVKLEQAISRKNELRQSANAQVVRDLRTLREAALILDGNKHTAECQRLVTVPPSARTPTGGTVQLWLSKVLQAKARAAQPAPARLAK